jgi:hypothetical protein
MAILLLGLRQTYRLYYWEKVIRAGTRIVRTKVVTTKIVRIKIVRIKIVRTKHC